MRAACLILVLCAGCGDFVVPPAPDMRVSVDLAVSPPAPQPDMSCFNRACGGCSHVARWDGTPAQEGDPCLWNGTLKCMGASLVCDSTACLTCSGTANGTVCGADGHTIVELLHSGNVCTAYDLGSAIAICRGGPGDHCVDRCVKNGSSYDCVAGCILDDGGANGCAHQASDTCDTLTSC